MNCARHREETLPCWLCQLEGRLPAIDPSAALELDRERLALNLASQARDLELLTKRIPMTGQLQGETLHIAALIRSLAKKLAA